MRPMWIGWSMPGHVIAELIAEDTGSQIRLTPPVELVHLGELEDFLGWIEDFCWISFQQETEPQVVDASDWREGLPAGI